MKHATMDWHSIIGLGVAGNFTGHLEQAGEASDFVNVQTADVGAPKGVFPFYVPTGADGANSDHFLRIMPISSETIRLVSPHENHQIEPELGLLCDLTYGNGLVTAIHPRWAMAHNDCSIRKLGARKISEKKNWGPDSKGTSTQWIAVDQFEPGGILDHFRLTSWLVREDRINAYGVDSAVIGYTYFYRRLLQWLMGQLNTQKDVGPLEDLPAWLVAADYPDQALISIGATRYTPFGEGHFLCPGDRAIVALYDGRRYTEQTLKEQILDGTLHDQQDVSILSQIVV
jgi:hypothetical protein